MKNLFLIDGTSSAWKDELINHIDCHLPYSTIIKKYTTRKNRENDGLNELTFINDDNLDAFNLEYIYRFQGFFYGFSDKQIKEALSKFDNVFLVVRNYDVIRKLKEKYIEYNVSTIFIYSDYKKTAKSLNIEEKKEVVGSSTTALEDYIRHPEIYDFVTISKSEEDFPRLIDHIISRISNQGQGELIHKNQTKNFSQRTKIIANIVFPILYAIFLAIFILPFTINIDLTILKILTAVGYIIAIIPLVVIQCFINIKTEDTSQKQNNSL